MFDEFGIPVVMQRARSQARGGRSLVVAAAIVIVRRVQRLVHIANQVQQKLQRDDAFRWVGRRAGQFRREFIDLVDHAVCAGPFEAAVPAGARDDRNTPDSDRARKLPDRRSATAASLCARHRDPSRGICRPRWRRRRSCGRSGSRGRRPASHRPSAAYGRLEILLRDQRDHLMPLIAPGRTIGRHQTTASTRRHRRAVLIDIVLARLPRPPPRCSIAS